MRLLVLHGPAASGKLTTARAVEQRIGYPVFHNHLVVDTLTTVFPFGSEPFVRLREQFWLAVMADAAVAGRSLIFTITPELTVGPGFGDRVRSAVEPVGGRVDFVQLRVSEAVQEERVVGADRAALHKLRDVETLRRLRRASTGEVDLPPADLVIDTDHSPPDRSADAIVAALELRPEPPTVRFPVV